MPFVEQHQPAERKPVIAPDGIEIDEGAGGRNGAGRPVIAPDGIEMMGKELGKK